MERGKEAEDSTSWMLDDESHESPQLEDPSSCWKSQNSHRQLSNVWRRVGTLYLKGVLLTHAHV